MKREVVIDQPFPALKYTPNNGQSIGTIMFFHGTGGCGTDINLVDKEWFTSQLASGALEIQFTVIAPQLPLRKNPDGSIQGWYKNDYNPPIAYGVSLGLPMHLTGLSLGSMAFDPILSDNPGVFSTAMSCAGKSETLIWNGAPSQQDLAIPELTRIPTVFYYGTADTKIPGGYTSMLALSQLLKLKSADNTWVPYIGLGHTIWPQSFTDYINNWLPSKLAPIAPPAPKPPTIWINDKDTGMIPPVIKMEIK